MVWILCLHPSPGSGGPGRRRCVGGEVYELWSTSLKRLHGISTEEVLGCIHSAYELRVCQGLVSVLCVFLGNGLIIYVVVATVQSTGHMS